MSNGVGEIIGGLLGTGVGAKLVREGYQRLGDVGDTAVTEFAGVEGPDGIRTGGLADRLSDRLAFQPYTVTTATGGQFGMEQDPDTGQYKYTADTSQAEQDLHAAQLQRAESLFGLATQGVGDRELQVFNRLREAMLPEEERARLALEERLAGQGRLGVRTAMFGGTPEQLAIEQAREEARANTMLAAMQYAGDEQQRQAQLGSGMLASGYVPQAQLIGALQPGMTASERGRQAIAQQTGAYGQTYASGLQALLASAVGQGNILGQAGGAIAESALGGLFSGLGKI